MKILGVFRSSPPEVFLAKSVLKKCSKFTGGHPCQSAISIKLQSNFIEITLWHRCSPVNLNTSRQLLLPILISHTENCAKCIPGFDLLQILRRFSWSVLLLCWFKLVLKFSFYVNMYVLSNFIIYQALMLTPFIFSIVRLFKLLVIVKQYCNNKNISNEVPL